MCVRIISDRPNDLKTGLKQIPVVGSNGVWLGIKISKCVPTLALHPHTRKGKETEACGTMILLVSMEELGLDQAHRGELCVGVRTLFALTLQQYHITLL